MTTNFIILNRNFLTKSFVTLLFFSTAIDMGGEFGLRNILVPICSLLLVMTTGLAFPKGWVISFFILIAYPTASLLIGILNGAELQLAFSQYQSTMFAFILFILIFRIPYEITTTALLYSLFVVALLAVFLAISLSLGIDSAYEILSNMEVKGGGHFGERGVTGTDKIISNVYFKTTLFFVPAFIFSLFTKRYFIAIVFFLALYAAVSKTGIMVTGLIAVIFLLRKANWKELLIGCALVIAAIIFIIQSPIFVFFNEIAQNNSTTVDVRKGHFESIINLWSDNPLSLFIGFGLGSTFYSSGADAIVSNIELDHFNVVRKYGTLWASLFFFWVLNITYKAIKNDSYNVKYLGYSLFSAFIVAGTNPVLISPVFFLFLFITMAASHQTSCCFNNITTLNKSRRQ